MVRKKILSLLLVKAPVAFVALSVALVVLLRWVPVRYTPVMLKRQIQSGSIRDGRPCQEWVPLEEVSPSLVGAVLASEDQRFMHHHGFDFQELKMMAGAHRKEGTPVRGCSTISQQTAKNVFTFGTPTVLRKVSEAWWTVLIETFWGKRRIMEVYLNVAETGPGLFGVQAASLHYFGVPAGRLDFKRSAAIALSLPDPLNLRPDCPGIRVRARMKAISGNCAVPLALQVHGVHESDAGMILAAGSQGAGRRVGEHEDLRTTSVPFQDDTPFDLP